MKFITAITVLLLFTITTFPQSAKKMQRNLSISLTAYFNPNCTISFDRKNPNKHGWNYTVTGFEKSFISKGFKVEKDNADIPHYLFLIDYDYGYAIANYKMQYSNMRGIILDVNNNSQQIGTFTYDGRYTNNELTDAIANKLSAIINDETHNKKPRHQMQLGKSKEEKLIELKNLFDKGLINQDDYNSQKIKILNE